MNGRHFLNWCACIPWGNVFRNLRCKWYWCIYENANCGGGHSGNVTNKTVEISAISWQRQVSKLVLISKLNGFEFKYITNLTTTVLCIIYNRSISGLQSLSATRPYEQAWTWFQSTKCKANMGPVCPICPGINRLWNLGGVNVWRQWLLRYSWEWRYITCIWADFHCQRCGICGRVTGGDLTALVECYVAWIIHRYLDILVGH